MRRGWTKSWRRVSALALGLPALLPGLAAQRLPGHRANEVALARLRPGWDVLAVAEKRFGGKHRNQPGSDDIKLWGDLCTGRTLRVEVDPKGVIQSVTVSSLQPRNGDCPGDTAGNDSLPADSLKTSRGLALGDSKKRVFALYGRPDSIVPSTLEGQEFELLFYTFDWAGPDVPQVMEVTCEPGSGRVRKITLAFPSL